MKSPRRAARESYVVRQMVSDPGSDVQCQVTYSAVKAYGGGFPEFTLDVRAVGRNLKRTAALAEEVYQERFTRLRQFMAVEKERAEQELLDAKLARAAKAKEA